MSPRLRGSAGVLERREGDDLRSRVLEQLEIFRVVEAEGVVEGHADAHRLRRACHRRMVMRHRVHRVSALHEPLDEVEVAVPDDRVAQLGDGLVDVRILQQWQQSGSQLRNAHRVEVGERTQHRHPCQRPDRVLDDPAPVVVGHVVEDHADHASRPVELLDPERRGSGGFAHRPCIDHQHDRCSDDACDFERAARELRHAPSRLVGHPVTVEHAHGSFHDHPIGADCSMCE